MVIRPFGLLRYAAVGLIGAIVGAAAVWLLIQ
jgi:putative flippase GtrA